MELITFKAGTKWVDQLWKKLSRVRKKRLVELDEMSKITFNDPVEVARSYIEPNSQEINPADRHEEDHLVSKEPIFKKIDEFFKVPNFYQEGNNQMFILSDAGMGKTSLLTILNLMYLMSFWPKSKICKLYKLDNSTLDKLISLENKKDTILLLDSLDEDPSSFGRVKERVIQILKATRNFHRVIITCRTQFFPSTDEDPFERPGLITLGGFVCPMKYLSYFDDNKVSEYLKKRFPKKFFLFSQVKQIAKAKKTIAEMGHLRLRPMLLAHIESLMSQDCLPNTEYKIYESLILSWLMREEAKSGNDWKTLLNACIMLAVDLNIKKRREISEAELDELIVNTPEVKKLKSIDIKGRSLLNRNSEGYFRFSHYTIQEFLVVKFLSENESIDFSKKFFASSFMVKLAFSSGNPIDVLEKFYTTSSDFRNINFTGFNLTGCSFVGANLKNCKFNYASLDNASFKKSNLLLSFHRGFRQAITLSQGRVTPRSFYPIENRIDLKKFIFDNANLEGCNFEHALLDKAIFDEADLSNCDFSRGVSAKGVNIDQALLTGGEEYI